MKRLFLVRTALPVFLLSIFHSAYSQTIATIAGTGQLGYSGDDGVATNAKLNHPWGMAVDRFGNVYFADYLNSRVRKINRATGTISTIAGTGVNGFNGDDIDARKAQLNAPMAVALDGADNIYIADDGNYRVRKINAANGKISTVAGTGVHGYSGDGGLAANAQLGDPWHLSFDTDNNLYITDYSNNRIRKVSATTGIITTVAGNGSRDYYGDGGAATDAALNLPVATAIDDDGNLYIADCNNNSIRKVSVATGTITTVAGNGTYGPASDNIPAISSTLAYPGGVAVDDSCNIYIADTDNGRVRKVNASNGLISTIAGNGQNGDSNMATNVLLNGPQSILLYSGNLFVADTYNGLVRKINNVYKEIPLKFVSVTGYLKEKQVQLQWEMNRKSSNYAYYVQYSTDQEQWTTVHGSVISGRQITDSISKSAFQTSLDQPDEPDNYYRIIAFNASHDTLFSEAQKISVALPVTFSSFVSAERNGQIELKWQMTDKGRNSRYFVVQYSTDQADWSDITTLQSKDSTGENSYISLMDKPSEVTNFYRIKSVTRYNDTIYSEVQRIDLVFPVSFITYTAKRTDPKIFLQWQIDDKGGINRYFDIQYSRDRTNWSVLKTVPAKDSLARNTYLNWVEQPSIKNNYYRVVSVNQYNDSVYSEVRTIVMPVQNNNDDSANSGFNLVVSIYPNPVTNKYFTLDMGQPVTAPINYSIVDLIGRTMQTGIITKQKQMIQVDHLSSGVYILSLNNGRTMKIIKR
jgi:sugar lactone lactonase YvrE